MNIKLLTHKYFWYELWWKIRDYFNPQQKWLFKKIGNGWVDKDYIIRETLFASIVHFAEEERGLELLQYQYDGAGDQNPDEVKDLFRRVHGELMYCYEYVKNGRPALEKRIDESWPTPLLLESFENDLEEMKNGNFGLKTCEERYGMPYEEAYGELRSLEEKLELDDTFVMKTIIDNRKFMWT